MSQHKTPKEHLVPDQVNAAIVGALNNQRMQDEILQLTAQDTAFSNALEQVGSIQNAGKEAEKALELVGLSTNKNMIPYDPRKPLDPSGIRVGTPAATTRGMKEVEMKIIARIFTQSIKALQEAKWYNSSVEDKSNMDVFENESLKNTLKTLKQEVLELCKKFPIYK